MSRIPEALLAALASRHPVIGIPSAEEARVLGYLEQLAAMLGDSVPVVTWRCTQGLNDAEAQTTDPARALRALLDDPRPGLFVFLDLPAFFGQAEVVRGVRDVYAAFAAHADRRLVLLAPEIDPPTALAKEVLLVELPPPDADELADVVRSVFAQYSSKALPEDWLRDTVMSLRGLALDEARHVLHRVLDAGKITRQQLLQEIGLAKKAMVGGAAYLDYVPLQLDLDAVGGLGTLKEWIRQRASVFSQQGLEAGLAIPKGILLMGISGCGKSLSAKVVAHTWRVPLFRLDMNMVFSQLHGNPEATFHQALKTVESVAPAVLWIDEIENGLGLTEQDRQVNARILSAFLTWMQEKPPLVFVAATANRIEALPAELIRKGRFDEVFFCDLPSDDDRREIFAIHIRRNHANPADFDLDTLIQDSKNWNAAEIEQAVIGARIAAAHAGHPFGMADIEQQIRSLVPLARTMHEQIKFIRDWAWDRATPASGGNAFNLETE